MNLILSVPPSSLAQAAATCAACRFTVSGGARLERAIPGLAVFGSGFGASIGESGLCSRHDRLVSPDDACAQFEAAER